MDNQKDTQKTGLNSYGQNTYQNGSALLHKPIYDYTNKKTEKLVTALYMVTDCMEAGDAIKSKLRHLGVDLLSHMHKLETLSPIEKSKHIVSSLSHIKEILSFVEMAYTMGYISEMNTSILKKEFNLLISELEKKQSKDKHFTFTLDENMFSLPAQKEEENNYINSRDEANAIKDTSTQTDKKTDFNTMSFRNNKGSYPKPIRNSSTILSDKKERTDKIIHLIKSSKQGHLGVSIKDISASFSDCSEKTIQRELNALVSKGQIKKIGAKRWSRYELA